MTFYKLTTVTVITILCLLGQVASQSDDLMKKPLRIENGPTGISVEAVEGQQHRFAAPRGSLVNGPTGFSVEAQEARNERNKEIEEFKEESFKEVEEDLQAVDEDGNPRYIVDDVDLESIDDDQVVKKFVNGHSGSSVHAQNKEISDARGVINTHPAEEGEEEVEQLAKGTHTFTTDWSTDSPEWSITGGEWSAVFLPDEENHPTIPTPPVPGKALVVVTDEFLKPVYAKRTIEPLENITLHFRYYLSSNIGEPESSSPELEVYQVLDEEHQTMVSKGTDFGVWSSETVELPYSGPSTKVVFMGRLNKLGNEIAIDDITISGLSSGPSVEDDIEVIPMEDQAANNTEGPFEVSIGSEGVSQGEDNSTVMPGEEVDVDEYPQDSENVTEKGQVTVVEDNEEFPGQENSTEKSQEAEQVTENSEDTELSSVNVNLTGTGNATYNPVEGSGDLEKSNETFSSVGSVLTDNPGFSVTEYFNDNMTMEADSNKTVTESTKEPELNQTYFINSTTDVNVNNNDTDVSMTTLLFNVTDQVGNNISLASTVNPFVNTVDPEIVDTKPPSINNNQSTVVVTAIGTNVTEISANISIGEGDTNNTFYPATDQATPGITNSPGVSSSDVGVVEGNTTSISLIIINSTSPSGITDTSPGVSGGNGTETDTSGGSSEEDGSSWSTFRVFAVISLLGVAVIGFLYWRRQKRRDDEIPVFSRGSSADYHNPTFSDDDSNFASRGTSHNYKSFD